MLFGFGGRLRSCGRRNMRRRAGGAFAYLPEFAYIRLSKKRIMIKNLVFDFGGIIADFEFSRALAAFERVGLKNPAEYLDSYHQRGFFRELESGRIGADEFVRRLGECAGREVSYAEAREAWLGFFLLPVPLERLACLEELRRDYRLYVLSNTNPFVMDWARSSEFSPAGKPLDAYFDKLFLSYEMKCMKPDRAIFDRMAAEAPLVPRRWVIGPSARAAIPTGGRRSGGYSEPASEPRRGFPLPLFAAEDRQNATEFAFALA